MKRLFFFPCLTPLLGWALSCLPSYWSSHTSRSYLLRLSHPYCIRILPNHVAFLTLSVASSDPKSILSLIQLPTSRTTKTVRVWKYCLNQTLTYSNSCSFFFPLDLPHLTFLALKVVAVKYEKLNFPALDAWNWKIVPTVNPTVSH